MKVVALRMLVGAVTILCFSVIPTLFVLYPQAAGMVILGLFAPLASYCLGIILLG